MTPTRYAVVTPVRNEAENLPRLANSLAALPRRPDEWIIVENGSTDATATVVRDLMAHHRWIQLVEASSGSEGARALPIVLAFQTGIESVSPSSEFIAKVDADITVPFTYFDILLERFAADPRLGIVSGTCLERRDGVWVERFGTGSSVWGAARMYRRSCLEQLLPLESRTAWDWIDAAEANVLGWRTLVVRDEPFHHHRREGDREQSRWDQWSAQGHAAFYLGYRPSYLVVRALYRSVRDPAALALLHAYVRSAFRREERCRKAALVAHVREQQRLRNLTRRAAEALGRNAVGR